MFRLTGAIAALATLAACSPSPAQPFAACQAAALKAQPAGQIDSDVVAGATSDCMQAHGFELKACDCSITADAETRAGCYRRAR